MAIRPGARKTVLGGRPAADPCVHPVHSQRHDSHFDTELPPAACEGVIFLVDAEQKQLIRNLAALRREEVAHEPSWIIGKPKSTFRV